jgi:FtsZ-binding cell division protein ZapB
MLTEKDSNKKSLFESVKFNVVFIKSMKEFLNKVNIVDIDFDLFSSMKFEIEHLKGMNEKLFQQNTQLLAENQHLNQINEQLMKEKTQISSNILPSKKKTRKWFHIFLPLFLQ